MELFEALVNILLAKVSLRLEVLRVEVRAVARSDTGSRVEQSDPVTGQSIHHPPLAVTCQLSGHTSSSALA